MIGFGNLSTKETAFVPGNIYTLGLKKFVHQTVYGNTGLHSMRKTFTNKLRLYFERKVKDSDIPFNPAEELQKEGRWKSPEAMEKYLSFRKIDFEETVFNYED